MYTVNTTFSLKKGELSEFVRHSTSTHIQPSEATSTIAYIYELYILSSYKQLIACKMQDGQPPKPPCSICTISDPVRSLPQHLLAILYQKHPSSRHSLPIFPVKSVLGTDIIIPYEHLPAVRRASSEAGTEAWRIKDLDGLCLGSWSLDRMMLNLGSKAMR